MRISRYRGYLGYVLLLSLSFFLAPHFVSAQVNPDIFAGLKARSIGPANMSGRISDVDAVISDPNIIYVGTAAGGVWKSTDGGMKWNPIFDDQPVASIGAVTICQKNPDIVWVGTGEAAPRNSVSIGRGVYRTLDGGRTWKCMGLEKIEKVAKIVLHPDNPDIVLVAGLGATWGDSPERGVFKSTDGGKTWRKVLYVNEKTGAADLAMDPSNPNRMLAAMWEHRRWPWFFVSGGPGSGIYLTTDGGETWEKLTEKNGLPSGDLGRCGLAFAPSRPDVVYALVEAKKSVLLRSADGGLNWQVVNNTENIHNRPFYYSRIWVNPQNENLLYMLASQLSVSEDGGKTFSRLTGFGQAHSDFHAMWIHPDGERMVVGNDGGLVISTNRGRNWRFVENLPIGQYYHIDFDMEIPYNVYGGLQDNGTWRGPAYSLRERTLGNHHWISVGGGDGFDAAVDPENPNCGYGMSQGGNLYYFDITTGTSRSIVPTESDVKHRFNWNAGFAVDPFRPAMIYLGSQFVHRSPDKGRTWEIISPDLTTNDPEKQNQADSGGLTLDVTNAENHCTILSIAPSPIKQGLIWVGTDDGNIQITRDDGKTWELVSRAMTTGKKPLAPAGAAVPHIEPSHFDEATAYVVLDDHRRSNFTPYVFVTRDYGKTWKSLVTPEIDGYCFVIKEDLVNKNLLFVGTEFGLFVSFNGGESWMKWTAGLPTCPVYDLAIHPRENDLIIATHGRSLYIIDDITPLREISDEITRKTLHLFSIPDVHDFQQGRMSVYMSPGDTAFIGANKALGASITYYLIPIEKKPEEKTEETVEPERAAMMARMSQMGGQMPPGMMDQIFRPTPTRVSIMIVDAEGKFVSQLSGTENKGLNRVYWNLQETEPLVGREREQGQTEERGAMMFFGRAAGISVLPGKYIAKVKYEDQEVSQAFKVKTDPRLKVDLEVLKANYQKAKEAQKLSRFIQRASRQIQQTQRTLQTIKENARMSRDPKTADLIKSGEALEKKLKEFSETMNPTPPRQGIADRSAGLSSQVMSAVSGITRAGIEPISQAALVKYEKAKARAEDFAAKLNAFFEKDVEEFKKRLQDYGFSLFGPFMPLKIE
ncbi:MAG: VPS10 domain-containing protein [Candidatus Aminicenantales bacterium]